MKLLFLFIALFISVGVHCHLDDDDGLTPSTIALIQTTAKAAVQTAGPAAPANASEGDEEEDSEAAAGGEDAFLSLPVNRLRDLERWRNFRAVEWRRLARMFARLDPFRQRELKRTARKRLGGAYSGFARRLQYYVNRRAQLKRLSRVAPAARRGVVITKRGARLSRDARPPGAKRSLFGTAGGVRFSPNWPRRRHPTRDSAFELVSVGRYVQASCHSRENIWALQPNGAVAKYMGGSHLQVLKARIPGGPLAIATSCEDQLWGLNVFGRVFLLQKNQWVPAPAGPKFVKIAVGADSQVYGLTRRGKLFSLLGYSSKWKQEGITVLRDISATCDGQVVGVNRHWRVVVRANGVFSPMGRSPRVKQVAVSTKRQGVVAVDHDGVVYAYRKGRWGKFPRVRLDSISLTKTGEVCGVYGRNVFIHWAGARAPSREAYRRMLTGGVSLSPDGIDPSPLMKDPFSLGNPLASHREKHSGMASATPDTGRPANAYVRDNLPMSTLDFKSVTPAPPGTFQSSSMGISGSDDAVQDPLPDTRQEVSLPSRARDPLPRSSADKVAQENVKGINLGFMASATPGHGY